LTTGEGTFVKRCLIVDDSEIVRKVARAIIGSMKYWVEEASTGEEALEACKAQMPDIIFLDWHMPGSNSIELIKNIRLLGVFKRPYILYCVTENDTAVLARAVSAGVDDIIFKPFDRVSITAKFAGLQVAAA
jgi:two-component system, chemotaxis family, chemotaxis protein CheY